MGCGDGSNTCIYHKLNCSYQCILPSKRLQLVFWYELATVGQMPVYTGLSYFPFQVYFSNISTDSQKSRYEPDSSKLQAKFASVVGCCISGTLHGPDLWKVNTQHFLNAQHSNHPPTGLIKIKALKKW